MNELSAAATLVAQTGADALYTQLIGGRLTPDEYHAAVQLVAPPIEEGPACVHCGKPAYIGATCATHASKTAARNVARASRPIVDLSRCGTPDLLITAVMTTLERTGREKAAGRFAARAVKAPGMNALCMIAKEYVRLENLLCK